MIEILAERVPTLHASADRVYGPDAYLFGLDLSLSQFGVLADECGVSEYERNQPLMFDGVQILPGNTLASGEINAVVAVPGSLIVRPTTLKLNDSAATLST